MLLIKPLSAVSLCILVLIERVNCNVKTVSTVFK